MNEKMAARQLSFIPDIDEKMVQITVIRELRKYKALKVKIENLREQEQAGIIDLFPIIRGTRPENELKVRQIDRALTFSMDAIEKKIIEMKYLSSDETNDLNIYLELGLKKDKYYKKKRSAIYHLATALGII